MSILNLDYTKIRLDDSSSVDSFGRLRVSTPEVMLYDNGYIDNDQIWAQKTSGSGTLVTTNATNARELGLQCGTASGDYIYRQTRARVPYIGGESRICFFSFFATLKTNFRQRVGLFCHLDGVFLQIENTNVQFTVRNNRTGSVVDTAILRANWDDPMDGTGESGLNLDFSKDTILFIDIQWLAMGRVRFGFEVDGVMYIAHEDNHSNITTGVYMGAATLPARWEAENIGAVASASTFTKVCTSILKEGGRKLPGLTYYASRENSSVSVDSTSFVHVLSFRLNSSLIHTFAQFDNIFVQNTSNSPIEAVIVANATLSGTSFSATDGNFMQMSTAGSYTSGGTKIAGGYLTSEGLLELDFRNDIRALGFDVDGTTPDVWSLLAARRGGSAKVYAGATFREVY